LSNRGKIGRIIALLVVGGLVILGGWLIGRQKDSQSPGNQDDSVENIPGLSTIAPTTAVSDESAEPASQPGLTPAPGEPTQATVELLQSEDTAVPANNDRTIFGSTPNPSVGLGDSTPEPSQEITIINPSPTPNLTPGIVGPPPTPAGRLAPDTTADPLQFQKIRIFMAEDTGRFNGQANMKNSGNTFLNGLRVSWQILGQSGQILDQGEIFWPNLAPGETTTVPLEGTAAYDDSWVRVEFSYSP